MRRIILFLFFLVGCMGASAQRNTFLQEIAVGVNGGMNFSKVSFLHNVPYLSNQLGDMGMRSGLRFGLTTRYIAQKHFGVQLELNFQQGGWSERFRARSINEVLFEDVTISRRINYLEVPLLAHIYFGNKARFFVNLGPKLGFVISYGDLNNSLSAEQLAAFEKRDPRIYDEGYNAIDYGFSGGVGMDFRIGRLHTIVEGRYTFGFADLYSSTKKDVFQRSNNQNVAVILTFMLPVKSFYR
jgi:hypothetical protein